MMKRYIKHIPNTVNYDLFPYGIIFSDDKYDTIIGVVNKGNPETIRTVYTLLFTAYNIDVFRRAKMNKSIANIIIKEIMKCT